MASLKLTSRPSLRRTKHRSMRGIKHYVV
jgi:hypothetical protein